MIAGHLLSLILTGHRYQLWERSQNAGITILFEDMMPEKRVQLETRLRWWNRFFKKPWNVLFREDLLHLGPVFNSFESERDPKLLGLVFFFQYPKTPEEIEIQSQVYRFRVFGEDPKISKTSSLFLQEDLRWSLYEILTQGWRQENVLESLKELEAQLENNLDQGLVFDPILMRDLKRMQAHFKEQKSFLFGKRSESEVK